MCLLRLPPGFPAVPHDLAPGPSCDPAPRRTGQAAFPASGSSVRHSASLPSSKGIQVGADLHARPLNGSQDMVVLVPVVRLTLTLAVEPLAQNARGEVKGSGLVTCTRPTALCRGYAARSCKPAIWPGWGRQLSCSTQRSAGPRPIRPAEHSAPKLRSGDERAHGRGRIASRLGPRL